MATNKPGYITSYRKRITRRNKHNFGNKCCQCFSNENLEFAHKSGMEAGFDGRGSLWRAKDIRAHPEKYLLMCHDCHMAYDQIHKYKELKE